MYDAGLIETGTLFLLTFAIYKSDSECWISDDFRVRVERVQIGFPFLWLRYTTLNTDGSPPAFSTMPQYEKYGRGLHVSWADLALDMGFIVLAGILGYVAWAWIRGLAAPTFPRRYGLRLAAVFSTAIVTGAALVACAQAERRAIGLGLLVIPLVVTATVFSTARSYLTMFVGAAVSVVGTWYGARVFALFAAETLPIGTVEFEELVAVGLVFVAYVTLLLPVVLASRIIGNGAKPNSKFGV